MIAAGSSATPPASTRSSRSTWAARRPRPASCATAGPADHPRLPGRRQGQLRRRTRRHGRAREAPGRRPRRGRRRRRQHRLGRRNGAPARRPALGRRGARARVLRAGRDASRPSPTPTSCSATSTPPDSPAASPSRPTSRARRSTRTWRSPLGLDVVEAARAVHDIVNATLAGAIRVVTVQRGIDPRRSRWSGSAAPGRCTSPPGRDVRDPDRRGAVGRRRGLRGRPGARRRRRGATPPVRVPTSTRSIRPAFDRPARPTRTRCTRRARRRHGRPSPIRPSPGRRFVGMSVRDQVAHARHPPSLTVPPDVARLAARRRSLRATEPSSACRRPGTFSFARCGCASSAPSRTDSGATSPATPSEASVAAPTALRHASRPLRRPRRFRGNARVRLAATSHRAPPSPAPQSCRRPTPRVVVPRTHRHGRRPAQPGRHPRARDRR